MVDAFTTAIPNGPEQLPYIIITDCFSSDYDNPGSAHSSTVNHSVAYYSNAYSLFGYGSKLSTCHKDHVINDGTYALNTPMAARCLSGDEVIATMKV